MTASVIALTCACGDQSSSDATGDAQADAGQADAGNGAPGDAGTDAAGSDAATKRDAGSDAGDPTVVDAGSAGDSGPVDDAGAVDGGDCDDADACTVDSLRQDGQCLHAPITCSAIDACHDVGTCDTSTGECSTPSKTNGAPCDDGDACTQADSCQAGVCSGADPVACNPLDQCHAAGTCNPATGACSNPEQPNDEPCDDGELCTQVDTCQLGVCTGAGAACPTNDSPAGAVDVSGGGTFVVGLTAAHDDDANANAGCGSTGGRDVFYELSLPAAEVVSLDTFGSTLDTVIRIYSGSCVARSGTPVRDDDAGVCAGSQSQLATELAAGTWCVVVDEYASTATTGQFVLRVVRGGRSGTVNAAANGSKSGDTSGLTNVTTAGCQANTTAPDRAYFFTVCPATTKTVGANTCTGTSWDSVVYLRSGPTTSSDVACSDDSAGCGNGMQSSFIGASAVGPGLFWLTVDGFGSATGAYTLTYAIN